MPAVPSSNVRRALAWVAAPVLVVGLLVGCSSSDDTTPATTSTSAPGATTTVPSTPSAATVAFDKTVQAELRTVGCYTGAVDGIIGKETDAAILAFQKASGLEADGELGPETDSALKTAASKSEKVCTGSPTTSKPSGTTSTTATSGIAPCTATAILAGLPGQSTLNSYVCADGWAAGSRTTGGNTATFILRSGSGKWAAPAQDPCGSASAGLPPIILEKGC